MSAVVANVEIVAIREVRPSPENDAVYHPVDLRDPAFLAFVESIRVEGVLEPIIVDRNGWIISGHRRRAAAKAAGLSTVPVRRLKDVSREDDRNGFVRLLAEHNRQRIKTFDERWNEEVLNVSSEDAYGHLVEYRKRKSDLSGFSGTRIKPGKKKRRKRITDAKAPMLAAVKKVIEANRDNWPLSDRQIHYRLLNESPLRHRKKKDSTYVNDDASWKDLCDLLTRARLTGDIPWEAIDDETRPYINWNVWEEVGDFIREQLADFLRGYARDLLQSQTAHIEIVGEKLTIKGIIHPIASYYCIPYTIGRGYNSLSPRHKLNVRYRASSKKKLVLICLSDFDPDGECITESFVRSMRDDFGIEEDEIFAVKAGLTAEQVDRYKLPRKMKAKETSSRTKGFRKKHGSHVWELEALTSDQLSAELRKVIESVIDMRAFEAERRQEAEDARNLEARRRAILKDVGGLA